MNQPTFNQNHSGSGDNIINFGKQKFALTDSILDELVIGLKGRGSVLIEPHGVQEAFDVASAIVSHLLANGVDAVLGGGTMMMLPPPSGPLELRGNMLLVDPSR